MDYSKMGQRDLLMSIANNTGGGGGTPIGIISKYKTQESIIRKNYTVTITDSIPVTDKDIEFVVINGVVYVDFVNTATSTTGFMCTQGTVIQVHVASNVSVYSTGTASLQIMVYSN